MKNGLFLSSMAALGVAMVGCFPAQNPCLPNHGSIASVELEKQNEHKQVYEVTCTDGSSHDIVVESNAKRHDGKHDDDD